MVKAGRTREEVFEDICVFLEIGLGLEEACKRVVGAPTPGKVLDWVESDLAGLGDRYTRARLKGYQILGDSISAISKETTAVTQVHERDAESKLLYHPDGSPKLKDVIVPLSADVMASKRLQVDTLKWKLSKMLPKIYGDKVTQEITGANGGPVQLAAVNLRNLSLEELQQMEALMSKAAGLPPG